MSCVATSGAEGTADAKAQDQREPDRFEGSKKASGAGIEKGKGRRWERRQGEQGQIF